MHSKSFHLMWGVMLEFSNWLICSNAVSGHVVYNWSYLLCHGGGWKKMVLPRAGDGGISLSIDTTWPVCCVDQNHSLTNWETMFELNVTKVCSWHSLCSLQILLPLFLDVSLLSEALLSRSLYFCLCELHLQAQIWCHDRSNACRVPSLAGNQNFKVDSGLSCTTRILFGCKNFWLPLSCKIHTTSKGQQMSLPGQGVEHASNCNACECTIVVV